ncbi:helix-turn-helix domain-containing protein [Ruficoccus sp. ZRK36]|uniref:helix-turn-helix transcriptional regulator n=1 Tax=Ruficoccus sp. ZRK36 TaxID=2866311 RepID=UPI001C73C4DF|nr:helix-turn-helix domain-containing protein [Ruficoccus sp. ZRK36]QYY35267.1 helix-turn-helix domain-containing protein [Ruficoccus sp. ZRK36]
MIAADTAISIEQVAKVLGISRRSVYRLIADGKLPKPLKDRGHARLLRSDVDQYLESIRRGRK